MSNTPSLWNKTFFIIMFANAFAFFAFDLLLPTLPLFLAKHGGLDISQIGLIIGSFTFSAIIIRPFTEFFTNKFGKKKTLVVSILICLISSLGYYFGTNFILALSIRILHGFGFGLAVTILSTLAAEIIPKQRRGEGMGMLGNGTTIALALSPFVGIWLFNSYNPIILFGTAGVSLLIFLFCISFISFPERVINSNQKETSFLKSLIEPSAIFPSFLMLLFGICMGGVISFMALYAKELEIEGVEWFYFVNTVSGFLIRFISGKVFDRKGHAWVLVPSSISVIIGFVLIYQTTTLSDLIIAAILYGMGTGSLFPSLQAWALNNTKPERYTKVTAMFFNSFDLGIGGGSAVLGLIAAKTNYGSIYLFSAFVMVFFLLVYCSVLFLNKQNMVRIQKRAN
ncbi:MFS transporter [Bacillus sp. ISL-75]|uniref:MFS transporter n=1 Tax=Bacillus sp. ISL-75 TaxID=2819137 RepID=UPI001BEB063E|nr:MFS transporter [Bacillus sp. ISL-75]MBT2725824.1 MFS transporter [Bacillus sp. ISL-75]